MSKLSVYIMVVSYLGWCSLAAIPVRAGDFPPLNILNPGKWFDRQGDGYASGDEPLPPPPAPIYEMPYGAPTSMTSSGYSEPGYAGSMAPLPPNYPAVAAPPPTYGYKFAPITAYPSSYYAPTPATSGYNTVPASREASGEPSREEMARRINDLEKRLEEMEAKNRQSVPAPQPVTPPPTSYQYYSGDQTPASAAKYPFRPLNLDR